MQRMVGRHQEEEEIHTINRKAQDRGTRRTVVIGEDGIGHIRALSSMDGWMK